MIKPTLFAFVTIPEWFHCSQRKEKKKKSLLLFIVGTKSLLFLYTRDFLLYLGIFIHSILLCLRGKPLLQTLNRTSPSDLGNVRSGSGSKLSSLGLSFIMVNQQSANLNNLFMLNFFFFFNCASLLANNGALFSALQDRKLFTVWPYFLNCCFICRGKS